LKKVHVTLLGFFGAYRSHSAPPLPHSESADIEVMAELLKILKPVSCALDKLQSEKNAYMGVLLPTLDILR